MNALLLDVNVGWTVDLSVGSAALDARNQSMLDSLAAADKVIAAGLPEPGTWLHGLLAEMEQLLKAEEVKLGTIGYPELVFHRQLHDRARRMMQSARVALDKATDPAQVEVVVRARSAELSVWFMRHIQDADKLFFPYIDARYLQPTS